MQSFWQKTTHRESIWPWIIPLVGILFLGFVVSGRTSIANIGTPESNIVEVSQKQIDAPALATVSETLSPPTPVERKTLGLTFSQYKVDDLFTGKLADLDTNSSYTARKFRTSIRFDMEPKGVNFAGHYTIVGVGMTGWDTGYWIVDRKTGKAYVFPYRAFCMNFQKDSKLIVINSKDIITDSITQPADVRESCDNITDDELAQWDYKPSYFTWENNKLKLIGPKGSIPGINEFWTKWFTPVESGVKL